MARQILTAFLLVVAAACSLRAQQTDYVFERIKIPGGFGPNRIMAIVQDQEGFMWIGTAEGGLFKHDGIKFTRFDYDRFGVGQTPESREVDLIWDIAVDQSGALWICPDERGLHRLDPRTDEMTSFRHDRDNPHSLSSDNTRSVFVDRSGTIWVGTDGGGLNRLDVQTHTFTRFRHDPDDSTSLPRGVVNQVYEDRGGVLWVATLGGLARFDSASGTFTRFEGDPGDETKVINSRVNALLEDESGLFWVGTHAGGLHTMDRVRGAFTRHPYDPNDPHRLSGPYPSTLPASLGGTDFRPVNFIHEDASGTLWIGGFLGGINVYDPDIDFVRHYEASGTNPNGLSNNMVFSIGESRDGVVWVGTLARGGKGLHKVTRVSPLRFHVIDSVNTGYAYSINEFTNGTLWVGLEDGLYILNRKSEGAGDFAPAVEVNLSGRIQTILTIEESEEGKLWIGGYRDGLLRFDPALGTFERFHPAPPRRWSTLDVTVTSIHRDSKRSLWIGTLMSGLVHLDPETTEFTYYQNDPDDPASLSSNMIIFGGIHEGADGSLWIATKNGLNRLDRESKRFDRYLTDRRGSGAIRGVVDGTDGRLWIGWVDGSLAMLDPETGAIEELDTRNAGLPGTEIVSMLGDDADNLWIMTDRAIARFNVSDGRFYALPTNPDVPQIDASFGVHRAHDGRLYFGALNGFYTFDPEQMIASESRIPPQVALTGLNVSGRKVKPGDDSPIRRPISVADEIRLAYGQARFSFDLAALHFVEPRANRIVYKLEGFDEDWRDAGSERRATYFRVPPGTYTFRAKAANPFGVWSEEEATISVVILPPWWQSWWAYCLYAVAVGFVLFGSYEVRVRHLRNRADTLERLVGERTRDLRAEKDRTEAQAKRLVELDEVKDRFFFNMSHEFRTPLTMILGPLHDLLASGNGEISTGVRSKLLVMQRNGRRLHRMISQLLDLSKLEVGRLPLQARERDIVPFVKHVVLSFAPSAERRKITLKFRSEVEEMPVFIDADKLEHVITNLVSNALKFTTEHGKILVDVAQSSLEGRPCAEISVQDTGVGIPAKELPLIFDRFHQAESAQLRSDGAGIGLALALEMVELHGGKLDVESKEGFGTTFTIRLRLGSGHLMADQVANDEGDVSPQHAHESEPSWAAEVQVSERSSQPYEPDVPADAPSVLIIDDNKDVRDYLRGHLEKNYRIIEAGGGSEGLAKTLEDHPDLVLADVMMPDMDGLELCRAIKNDDRTADIPVILVTARASEEAEVEGLEAGADDYVSKPFGAEALLARVENLIEIRRFLRDRFGDEVTIRPLGVTVESSEAVFLEQVKKAIEAHIDDTAFSVEWLADEVGVSPRQLRRKLNELVNLSPSGYIRMVRLEHAAELLRHQAGNVSQVAYSVGFKDPRYFSRLFRQTFGVTPSTFPVKKDLRESIGRRT